MPHFLGHNKQRGSDLGSLGAGVEIIGLFVAPKVLQPDLKWKVQDLFVQSVPEVMDVVTKEESPKQAMESAVDETARNKSQ